MLKLGKSVSKGFPFHKGSECTFYKGIFHNDVNVLGRYGYFHKISEFVKLVESSVKIFMRPQRRMGTQKSPFKLKMTKKKPFPSFQRAQNRLFTKELSILRMQMRWEGMGIFHKNFKFCKTSRALFKNTFGGRQRRLGAQKPHFKRK